MSKQERQRYQLKSFGDGQVGLMTEKQDERGPSMLALTMCLIQDGSPQSFRQFISMLRNLANLNASESDEPINISVTRSELDAIMNSSEPARKKTP